jgi:uncharacterized protein DUF899
MEPNRIVSRDEWLVARKPHLAREKELTRLRDQVSAERRELPWVKVEKDYVFDGPDGKETLADLFDGRSQLIVYHFMFAPRWTEGCDDCSFLADHIDGANMTSRITTCRWWRSREHRWSSSERSKSAWGGGSNGYRRTAATSTTTSTSPRRSRHPRRVQLS